MRWNLLLGAVIAWWSTGVLARAAEPDPLAALVSPKSPDGRRVALERSTGEEGEEVRAWVLFAEAEFGNERIQDVSVRLDPETGSPAFALQLDAQGKDRLAKVTAEHLREHLAILLDSEVMTVPLVVSPITEGKLLLMLPQTSSLERAVVEANTLVRVLKGGPLPVAMQLTREETTKAGLALELEPADPTARRKEVLRIVQQVAVRRLQQLGIDGIKVKLGPTVLRVELAGGIDPSLVKPLLTRVGKLEFLRVDDDSAYFGRFDKALPPGLEFSRQVYTGPKDKQRSLLNLSARGPEGMQRMQDFLRNVPEVEALLKERGVGEADVATVREGLRKANTRAERDKVFQEARKLLTKNPPPKKTVK